MKDNQAILADGAFRHIVTTGTYMDGIKAFYDRRFPGRKFIDLTSSEIDEAIAAVDLVRHENAIKRAAIEKEMR